MRFQTISEQFPLILASASPRRKELLTQLGLPFRSVVSQVREEEAGGEPREACRFLAEKKAAQVYATTDPAWVLGADTIVAVGNTTLGKPEGKKEAREMLSLLSGKEHRVITGFCVLNPSGMVVHCEAITTLVRFKKLSSREVEGYMNTGEPFGKAGSYAIQGMGAFMVESISGSYSNVVGLPLCALIKAFVTVGALKTFPLSRV
jgi:septum formation protein